jgi:phosphatidylglycerophosphate synthase
MIDRLLRPLIDPPLHRAGRALAAAGIRADALSVAGCGLGLGAALAIAYGHFGVAFLLIIANRLADGLDGAVAHATQRTDRGAFLDITLDFAVYAAVPLAFAIFDPAQNALAASVLLASYLANGSAFLAFSIMAEKRGITTDAQGQKSIYYLAGLAEGFETIAFMLAVCVFPGAFALLAMTFAALCATSAAARIVLGWRQLH